MNSSAITTYRHALQEMRFVAGCWFLAFLWTVGVCYLHGYQHAPNSWVIRVGLAEHRDPSNFGVVMGLPDWVAYGIVAPWLVCSVVTVIYGQFVMTDDDLGTEADHEA